MRVDSFAKFSLKWSSACCRTEFRHYNPNIGCKLGYAEKEVQEKTSSIVNRFSLFPEDLQKTSVGENKMRMLLVIATMTTFALVSSANADQVSNEGQIPSATLADFGLGEMSLVSDADGEQIRGTYRYGYKSKVKHDYGYKPKVKHGHKPKVKHKKHAPRPNPKVIVKKRLNDVKYKIEKALYTAVKKSKYNPHVIKSAKRAYYSINHAFNKVHRRLH